MNLNKAMIIGNLTRDPEMRTTPSGVQVARFGVATNFVWNDQSGQKQTRVEYHNVVAWRRLAEICGQYLRKGSKVYIEGRLQTSDWVGQQDNVKHYRTEIIADNMIMLDRAGTNLGGDNSQFNAPPTQQETGNNVPVVDVNTGVNEADQVAEDEIKVENIPF